jgi:hypothetical protein
LDRRRGPFRGGAHARQDEGGSDRAAECAVEEICETAGNVDRRNASDDSGSHGCSQRKPDPDRRGDKHGSRNLESDSYGSSDGFRLSGGVAIGLRQNASVTFAVGFCIACAERNCRAAKFADTRCIDSAGRHAVSNGICVPHGENATISACAQAFTVDCVVTRGFGKHASGANSAAHSASSCQHTSGRRNASNNPTRNDSAACEKAHHAARGDSASGDARCDSTESGNIGADADRSQTDGSAPDSARFRIVSGSNPAQRRASLVANCAE